MSIFVIFFLTFYMNIMLSNSINMTQFENFTVNWQIFDIVTCAIPKTIDVSLFSCLPLEDYTQVDDMSCLQETTIDVDPNGCESSTTGMTFATSQTSSIINNTTQTASTTPSSVSITIVTPWNSIDQAATTGHTSLSDTTTSTITSSTTYITTIGVPQSSSATVSVTNSVITTQPSSLTTSSTTQPSSTIISSTTYLTTVRVHQSSSATVTGTTQTTASITTHTATIQTSTTSTNNITYALGTTVTVTSTINQVATNGQISVSNTAPITPRGQYQCAGDFIGSSCNISSDVCAMSQPCLNAATCFPNNTVPSGYNCQCQSGYTGMNCQNDERICKENTCWNNGTCIEMNSTISTNKGSNFKCECKEGYDGIHCELHVDLCVNITCENHGVCQTTDMVWKCQCLDSSLYYGDYCQFQTSSLKIKKALSKSFASVAITAIVTTCSFVILMDALKYIFHIDPLKTEREKYQKQKEADKQAKKLNRPKVAIRFQYIA